MKLQKKKVLFVLKTSSIIFVGMALLLFVFRNTILQQVIHRIDTKLNTEYECHFTVGSASFRGITHLEFQNISLVPQKADTLVQIQSLKTSISLWKLCVGELQLGELDIDQGYIQLVKTKNGSNFDAFLRSKKDKSDNTEVNYAKLLNRISSKILNLVPTDMHVKGFAFKINDLGKEVVFDFNQLALTQKKLNTVIQVTSEGFSQQWTLNGFADPRERKARLKFYNAQNDTIQIPYLDKKYHLKTGFKAIHFNLDNLEMDSGELHLDGYASIENAFVNHPKIAQKDVLIHQARFDYHFIVGDRRIALDSTSKLQLNRIQCLPFISYSNEEDKVYSLQLTLPKMKAQDFIESLPTGLFSHFGGMKAQGYFSYALQFEYNNHKPSALIFESKLHPEGLTILKYGAADLNKINTDFTYRAIEHGVPQRQILVGLANPMYTPLTSISPYLQKCVLTSEDPSFFNHRGFINEAFKQSIAKNIRTKKFSRGASTISMQLVKNVFLTRQKTVSRKLEEILLVYLLENNHISTKERMLEVYFNIIEWGPNVYGIGEASQFYFQKSPADLSLNECLFLATIIPRPKGFMYRFDSEHVLKSYAKQQHNFLTKLMLRRNVLVPTDTIGQHNPLVISGVAQYLLHQKTKDSIVIDSLSTEEFDF
jgi:hypothetical protein